MGYLQLSPREAAIRARRRELQRGQTPAEAVATRRARRAHEHREALLRFVNERVEGQPFVSPLERRLQAEVARGDFDHLEG